MAQAPTHGFEHVLGSPRDTVPQANALSDSQPSIVAEQHSHNTDLDDKPPSTGTAESTREENATTPDKSNVAEQIAGFSLALRRVEKEVRKASMLITYACLVATVAVLRL